MNNTPLHRYRFFQRHGLNVAMGLTVLILLLCFWAYSSSTYILLPSRKLVALSKHLDQQEQARTERKENLLRKAQERQQAFEARGIVTKEQTPATIAQQAQQLAEQEKQEKAQAAYAIELAPKSGNLNPLLGGLMVFLAVATTLALVFPLVGLYSNLRSNRNFKPLWTLGTGVVVILGAYCLFYQSHDNPVENSPLVAFDPAAIQQAGAMLYTTTLLLGLALVAVLAGEVYSNLKANR